MAAVALNTVGRDEYATKAAVAPIAMSRHHTELIMLKTTAAVCGITMCAGRLRLILLLCLQLYAPMLLLLGLCAHTARTSQKKPATGVHS